MLVAAAVCPCPPLLVPAVAAGAASELADARTACSDALAVLAASRPDRLVVIGPAEEGARGVHPAGAAGSFAGFGVDLTVRLGSGPGGERALPASLAVGAWLLEHTDWADAPIEGLGVGTELQPARCAEAGREIGASAERVALLVMGDGSACRTVKAPGYLDERAEGFDAAVGHALGTADPAALLALDPELAQALQAAGRAPWQVLAGAAEGTGLEGRLLYEDAPYGVGYFVAAWS
ncbi:MULTISPECIES: class III extradiol dioxygenase subunit B-like domain-containing protein [unclassified Streptomyces]|uniref:class III extradiol dioxygenase subunit B-like domain-containing protein n=1 Tax=unclassified Streptomyces TaxID=2593676 RepID=UPI002E33E787|nr:class III extradiol dioxygenase subunit B-like domain-containing protein [Streptomyces sp. NBC_01268]